MPVVEFGDIEKDPGDVDFLGNYSLEDLIRLYSIGNPIPEDTEEKYEFYLNCVDENSKPYWNLMNLKKIISCHTIDLEVSNYGNIRIDGENVKPNNGKIYIDNFDFLVYRLVAEVFCENPKVNLYNTVHHIGNDNYNNAKNLLFVTRFQHDKIYEILHS